jgi:hypothetical protein
VDLRDLVTNHDVRPERPEQREAPQLTDGVWELAENCWFKEPGSRPVAGAVCNAIVRLLDAPVHSAGVEERPQGAAAPITGLGLRLDHEVTARTVRADASELALQLKNPSAYLFCCLPSLPVHLLSSPPFQRRFILLLTDFFLYCCSRRTCCIRTRSREWSPSRPKGEMLQSLDRRRFD